MKMSRVAILRGRARSAGVGLLLFFCSLPAVRAQDPLIAIEPYDVAGRTTNEPAGTARMLADELTRAGVPAYACDPLDGRMRPWPESVVAVVRVGVQVLDDRAFTATLTLYQRHADPRGYLPIVAPSDDSAGRVAILDRLVDVAVDLTPERIRLTPTLHAEMIRRRLARDQTRSIGSRLVSPFREDPFRPHELRRHIPFARTNQVPPAVEALLSARDACVEVLPTDPRGHDPALIETLTGGSEFFRDWLRTLDLPVLPAGTTNGLVAFRLLPEVSRLDATVCDVRLSVVRVSDGARVGFDVLSFSRERRRPNSGGMGAWAGGLAWAFRPKSPEEPQRFGFSPVSSNLKAAGRDAEIAEETAVEGAALRVALIPTRHDPASEALAARLLVLLGDEPGVAFVDRDQVNTLLDQQRLAVSTLARAAGRTWRADVIVPLNATTNGVDLTGITTRDGTCLRGAVATGGSQEDAAVAALRELLGRIRALRPDTLRISLNRFVSRDIDPGVYALERPLTDRVEAALTGRSGVVLTERSRLSFLEEEFWTAGASARDALRGDVLVTGDLSVERTGSVRRVSLQVRIAQPGHRAEVADFPLVDGNEQDAARAIADWIVEHARAARTADTAAVEDEARAFFARGSLEQNHGHALEAIPQYEAACMLDPARPGYREALWSARTNVLAAWTRKSAEPPVHTLLFWLEVLGDAVVCDAAGQRRHAFPLPDAGLLLSCAAKLPDHPAIQHLAARAVQGEFEAQRARFLMNPKPGTAAPFRTAIRRMTAAGQVRPDDETGARMIVDGFRGWRDAQRLWPEEDQDSALMLAMYQAGRATKSVPAVDRAVRTMASGDDPLLRVAAIRTGIVRQMDANGGPPSSQPLFRNRAVRRRDTNDVWLGLTAREFASNERAATAAWCWLGWSTAIFAEYWTEANGEDCAAFGDLAAAAAAHHGRPETPGPVMFCEALAGAWLGIPEAFCAFRQPIDTARSSFAGYWLRAKFDCRWAGALRLQTDWLERNNPDQFVAVAPLLAGELGRRTNCAIAAELGSNLIGRANSSITSRSRPARAVSPINPEPPAKEPAPKLPADFALTPYPQFKRGWPEQLFPRWETLQSTASGSVKLLFAGGGALLPLRVGTFDPVAAAWSFSATARVVRLEQTDRVRPPGAGPLKDAWQLFVRSNECFATHSGGGSVWFGPRGEARPLTDADGLPAGTVTALTGGDGDVFYTGHTGGVGRWDRPSRSWKQLFGSRLPPDAHPLNGGRPYDVLALLHDPDRQHLLLACRGDRGGVWMCPQDGRPATRRDAIPQPEDAAVLAGSLVLSGLRWFQCIDPRDAAGGFSLAHASTGVRLPGPVWRADGTPMAGTPQIVRDGGRLVFVAGSTVFISRPTGEIRAAEIAPSIPGPAPMTDGTLALLHLGNDLLLARADGSFLLRPVPVQPLPPGN